ELGLRAAVALPERRQDRPLLGRQVVAVVVEQAEDVAAHGVVRLVQPEHDRRFGRAGEVRHQELLLQQHCGGITRLAMGTLVTYRLEDSLATITMDDGKVNVLSMPMFAELNAALDRAEADRAAVLLAGRPNVFSGGFDLKVLMAGGRDASTLVLTGFRLGERLLGFPHPVVV